MRVPRVLRTSISLSGIELPVATVVAPLAKGPVVISPGSRLDEAALRECGAVTDLVGPSLIHLGGLERAARIHPSARLWGPPGAKAKLPGLPGLQELSPETWPHGDELPFLMLGGSPRVNECAFLHRASRTLVVQDLAFNLMNVSGLWPRMVFSAFGTYRRFAVSRLFLSFFKDKAALRASLARLLEWEFDRVVVAHGEVVEADGKARLRAALAERGL